MEKDKRHKLFDRAYKEFAQGIVRFIYFRVSDYELAQELTADTFVRFWKQTRSASEIRHSKALLYTIARGLLIDYYRKKERRKTSALDVVDERLLSHIDKTEDVLLIQQEIAEVLKRMKKIKKTYQEVLLLHYVEDLSVAEIANVLEKKENTVRVLLHRALSALKEVL